MFVSFSLSELCNQLEYILQDYERFVKEEIGVLGGLGEFLIWCSSIGGILEHGFGEWADGETSRVFSNP
jgi:hypothetical protein